ILITNATMLEYMLVRHEDTPILNASQVKLRWIVLDETNIYIGSQTTEITLLLRRVLHAIRVEQEQVRFVATSATIGKKGAPESQRMLQDYLADIAGVPRGTVHVIEGDRHIPDLPKDLRNDSKQLGDLAELATLNSEQQFRALASVP